MDFTQFFIGEKYFEAIGWTLAHSVWQIALISLLLWFIVQVIPKKSSQWRYATAFAALLFIFAASCWTFIYQLDQFEKTSPLISPSENVNEERTFIVNSDSFIESPSFGSLLTSQLEDYLPFVVNLWILGAVFYFIRLAGSLYDLEKLHKKHHQPVSNTVLRKVDSLATSMGIFRSVQVLKSSLVHAPVTYGLIKPVILLPASLAFSISPEQLEAIIAHELAHIKRYDYLANFVQSVMEVLFFFHPCFWWINRFIQEEREIATDDLALAIGINANDLAYGLAEIANQCNFPTPEMTLAASEKKNLTLLRIKRIMGKPISSPKLSPLIPITMILALIISSIIIVGAQEQENKNSDALLLTHIKSNSAPWEEPVAIKFRRKEIIKINQDTIPNKEKPKAPNMEGMPKLELPPAPEMDIEIPALPEIPPVPPAPVAKFNFPDIDVRVQSDSLGKMARELQEIEDDNSPEARQRRQTLKSAMAKVEQNIEELAKVFEVKMEDWQKAHGESFEKFENDMKLWEEKMKDHGKAWESSFAPKMKEFEEKMKQWEKENGPKLKEFEEKMKIWEKENAPKLKQFEKEMEIWMKENKENIQPKESTRSNNFLNFYGSLNAPKKVTC